jgi:hypothetical protein
MTTTFSLEVRQQPKVKAFLERKSRNSQNTADSYLLGLTAQKFLDTAATPPYFAVNINELGSLFTAASSSASTNIYEFLDAFISYLTTSCKLSPSTVSLYVGYLENCDVEINLTKFKNKVTMPKNHRED